MTKQNLQKELLEKVKPSTKPSDLRKLKRSKSADDILASPSSQEKQITQLQEQVKFHAETASNYLKSLQTSQAKVSELEEKLKHNPPTNTELDQALFKRHLNLKDWFTQYQENKELDTELQENINEASTELISQDQTISQLQGEVRKLKLTNQQLTKDLSLSQRLAEMRKVPLPDNSNSYPFLKYALYTLFTMLFVCWILPKNN